MIDYQRIWHTGLLVHDLSKSMDEYSRGLALRWAKPFVYEKMTLWTPEQGVHTLRIEVTFSIDGPQHLEIQKGSEGSFYDPQIRRGDHVGIWVDNIPRETQQLIDKGWKPIGAGNAPEAGWGTFCYLTPPDGGLTVELVDVIAQPRFKNWFGGADGPIL